jgi:ABC-type lipoprotein release transport system permease subunit
LQLDKRLQTGRLFSNPTAIEIVLTEGLAEVLELGVGDSVVLISQGYRGQSAYGLYPVVGTVKLASPELNRSMAFLPLEEARYLLGAAGSATQVVLKMNNEEADDKWLAEAAFVIDTANYRLYGWKELMPELVQAISADSAGGIIMIIILYMVIAFGLMGTVLMMTAERQHEFGVLVALGMKRNQLALMTALESVLLTLIGSIAGLLLAAPVVTYFYLHPIEFTGQMAETMLSYGMEPLMPASIKPSIALFNAGSVVLISLLCALYPVVKIRHLQPVKAMRS